MTDNSDWRISELEREVNDINSVINRLLKIVVDLQHTVSNITKEPS